MGIAQAARPAAPSPAAEAPGPAAGGTVQRSDDSIGSGDGDDDAFITVHGETLAIDETDRGDAERLIVGIVTRYAVRISSDEVFERYKRHFNKETEELVRDQVNQDAYRRVRNNQIGDLGTSDWTLEQLRDLDAALGRYGQIVKRGKRDKRELFCIGRLNEDVENSANPALVSREQHILAVFDALDDDRDPYGTLLHELAHATVEHRLSDFVRAVPYWRGWRPDDEDWAPPDDAEAPPTARGRDAPYEDLAECMMLLLRDAPDAKKKPSLDKLKKAPVHHQVVAEILRQEILAAIGPARKIGGRRFGPKRR